MAYASSDKPVFVLLPDGTVEIYDSDELTACHVLREHPGCTVGLVPDWRKSRLSPDSTLKGGITYHLSNAPSAGGGEFPAQRRLSGFPDSNSVEGRAGYRNNDSSNGDGSYRGDFGNAAPTTAVASGQGTRTLSKHLSPVTPLTVPASFESDDSDRSSDPCSNDVASGQLWAVPYTRGSNPSTPRGAETRNGQGVPNRDSPRPFGMEGNGPWDVPLLLSEVPESERVPQVPQPAGRGARPQSSSGRSMPSLRDFIRTVSADRSGLDKAGVRLLSGAALDAPKAGQEVSRPAGSALWSRGGGGGLRGFMRGGLAERASHDSAVHHALRGAAPDAQIHVLLEEEDLHVKVNFRHGCLSVPRGSPQDSHVEDLPRTPRPRRSSSLERPGFGLGPSAVTQRLEPKHGRMVLWDRTPLLPADVAEAVNDVAVGVADTSNDGAGRADMDPYHGEVAGRRRASQLPISIDTLTSTNEGDASRTHAGIIPSPTKVPSLVAGRKSVSREHARVRPLARANSATPGLLRRQVNHINHISSNDPLVLAAFRASASDAKATARPSGTHPPKPPAIARTLSADHSDVLAHACNSGAAHPSFGPERPRSIAQTFGSGGGSADSAGSAEGEGDAPRSLTPAPPLPRRQGQAPVSRVYQNLTSVGAQHQTGNSGQLAGPGNQRLARGAPENSLSRGGAKAAAAGCTQQLARTASAAPRSNKAGAGPLPHSLSAPPTASGRVSSTGGPHSQMGADPFGSQYQMGPRQEYQPQGGRGLKKASSEKGPRLDNAGDFSETAQERGIPPSRSAAAANLSRMREGLTLLLPGTPAAGRARTMAKSQSGKYENLPPKSPKSPVFGQPRGSGFVRARPEKSPAMSAEVSPLQAFVLPPRQPKQGAAGSGRESPTWGAGSPRAETRGSFKLGNPFKLSSALEVSRGNDLLKSPQGKSPGGSVWGCHDGTLAYPRGHGPQHLLPGSPKVTEGLVLRSPGASLGVAAPRIGQVLY